MYFLLFSSDDSGGVCNGVRFLLGFGCDHYLHRVSFPWFGLMMIFILGLMSRDLSGCRAVSSVVADCESPLMWLCQSVVSWSRVRSTVFVHIHSLSFMHRSCMFAVSLFVCLRSFSSVRRCIMCSIMIYTRCLLLLACSLPLVLSVSSLQCCIVVVSRDPRFWASWGALTSGFRLIAVISRTQSHRFMHQCWWRTSSLRSLSGLPR